MKNLFKWILISASILAIGTFLYAQTAVIGIPWELRGVDVYIGTQATGKVFIRSSGAIANPDFASINFPTTGITFAAGPAIYFSIAGAGKGSVGADYFNVTTNYGLNISGTLDNIIILGSTRIYEDAANELAQRNGVNAQKFHIYSTYTDAGNYERLAFNTAIGGMTIIPETAGTGTDDINLILDTPGNGNLYLQASGSGIVYANKTTAGGLDVFNVRTEPGNTDDPPLYRFIQNDLTTVDATVSTLNTLALLDNTVYLVEARIVARCTGGAGGNAGKGAAYICKQAFKRSGGGATAIGVLTVETWEDVAGWDGTLDVNGNNVRIRVTGGATDNMSWTVTLIVQNISS